MKINLKNVGTLSFGLVAALILSSPNVAASEDDSTFKGDALGLELGISSVLESEISDVLYNGDANLNIESGLEDASEAIGAVEEISNSLTELAASELENIRTQAADATAQLESTLTEPVIDEIQVGVFDTQVTASEDRIEAGVSSAVNTEISEVVQANGEVNVNITSGLEGASEAIGAVEEISNSLNELAASELENIRTQAADAIPQLETTLTEPVIDGIHVGVFDTQVTASEDGIEVGVSSALNTEISDVLANGDTNLNIASGLEGASEAIGAVEEISNSLNGLAASELENIRTQAADATAQLESALTELVIDEIQVGVFDTQVTASEDGIEAGISSTVNSDISEVVQANGEANVTIASGLEGASEASGAVEEISNSLNELAISELENIRTQAADATAQLESSLSDVMADEFVPSSLKQAVSNQGLFENASDSIFGSENTTAISTEFKVNNG